VSTEHEALLATTGEGHVTILYAEIRDNSNLIQTSLAAKNWFLYKDLNHISSVMEKVT
jgi:hypothetical protein